VSAIAESSLPAEAFCEGWDGWIWVPSRHERNKKFIKKTM
jgi:hypothetical protein